MFHFLQDMVHSVAAEPNKNQGRVSIHWHEVVLLCSLLRSSALHVPAMNTPRRSAAECTEPQPAVAGVIAALLGGLHAASSFCNDKQAKILPIHPFI